MFNSKKFYDSQSNPSYSDFSESLNIGVNCRARLELFYHLNLEDLDILEVGIGNGANFKFYNSEKIKSLVVTDYSVNMLNLAKQNLRYFKSLNDKISFLLDDATKFNKKFEEKFDLIIITFNLSGKNDKILSNLSRYIKKNGIIAIADSQYLFSNQKSIFMSFKKSIKSDKSKLDTWTNIYKIRSDLKLIRNKSFYIDSKKDSSILIFKKL